MAALDDTETDTEYRGSQSDTKTVRLSLHLIVKRHLPKEAKEWSQQRIVEELNKIKRVRLDRENIFEIDSLELLSTHVTNLFLQNNKIKRIQNLECLPNLQVLILSSNCIANIEGISHLQKLIFLDISQNLIADISTDQIPDSVIILNLDGNDCTGKSGHRERLIQALHQLKQLDGVKVTKDEKLNAGVHCSSSETSEEEEDNDDGEDEIRDDKRPQEAYSEVNMALNHLTVEPPTISGNLHTAAYKQLPKIHSNIQDFTTDILLRSQNRLETSSCEHKRHIQEITNARIKMKIRPLPHISKPS